MKCIEYIYEDGLHRWAVIRQDEAGRDGAQDASEYLVVNGRHALLCAPGGDGTFPEVFAAISTRLDPRQIGAIFAPAPDPDTPASLGMWLEVNPGMKCHASWLWRDFLSALDEDGQAFANLPDDGTEIMLGNLPLQAVPVHGLYAPGTFQLYDAKAGILFSGNVGAALSTSETGLFVKDFDRHRCYVEQLHRSRAASKADVLGWCEWASRMKIDMLCPQQGPLYRGADVTRFINWLAELEIVASHREVA